MYLIFFTFMFNVCHFVNPLAVLNTCYIMELNLSALCTAIDETEHIHLYDK